MGILTKETKAAIRRGAWCNNPRIPQSIKDAALKNRPLVLPGVYDRYGRLIREGQS